MITTNLLILTIFTHLLAPLLANPITPSLQHRQLGSCTTTPCAPGLCCSIYDYCGTGSDYCQPGSCDGGVGASCAFPLCCSPYGYCGTGEGFCTSSPTTTSIIASPTATVTPVNTGPVRE